MRIYTTQDGDRLDLIAYRLLGTPKAYADIIAANSNIGIMGPIRLICLVKLPAGITLNVPDRSGR